MESQGLNYYERNKTKILERQKKYNKEHQQECIERNKKYYNKEYFKEYYHRKKTRFIIKPIILIIKYLIIKILYLYLC